MIARTDLSPFNPSGGWNSSVSLLPRRERVERFVAFTPLPRIKTERRILSIENPKFSPAILFIDFSVPSNRRVRTEMKML